MGLLVVGQNWPEPLESVMIWDEWTPTGTP